METVPPLPPLSVSQRALDLGSVPRSPPKKRTSLLRRVSTRVRSSFLGFKAPTSPPPCPPTIAEHLTLSPQPMEPPPLRRQTHALPMPPRLGSSSSGTPSSSLLSPSSTRFASEDQDGSTLTLPMSMNPTDTEPMLSCQPTASLVLSKACNNKGPALQSQRKPGFKLGTKVLSTMHEVTKTPFTPVMDPLYALPLLLAKRDLTAQDTPRSPTEQSDLPLSPDARNDQWVQAPSRPTSVAGNDDHSESEPEWEALSRPWSHTSSDRRRVHRTSRGWSASNFSAFDGQPVTSDTEHAFPWSSEKEASGEPKLSNHLGLDLGQPNTSFATAQAHDSGLLPTDLWCSAGVEAEEQAAMVAARHAALSKLLGEPSGLQPQGSQPWDEPVQSRSSATKHRPKLAQLRLPPPLPSSMKASFSTPTMSPYPFYSTCPTSWKTLGLPLGSPLELDSWHPEAPASPSCSNSPSYTFFPTSLPRSNSIATTTLPQKVPPTPTLRRKAPWSSAHPLSSTTEAHGYTLAQKARIHRWLDQVSVEASG